MRFQQKAPLAGLLLRCHQTVMSKPNLGSGAGARCSSHPRAGRSRGRRPSRWNLLENWLPMPDSNYDPSINSVLASTLFSIARSVCRSIQVVRAAVWRSYIL